MENLTGVEKRAVINCIAYQAKCCEIEGCKLEKEYNSFDGFNQAYSDKIQVMKDAREFYINLGLKVDKLFEEMTNDRQ